jgi:ATP-independent RNA helicase DbpA
VSTSEFARFALPAELLEGLQALGFTRLLPVQAQALPPILEGKDVIVRSQTGSGKTLAFGLGMLARLEARLDVQALALCPTRELADQVAERLRQMARRIPNVKVLSLCGGVPFAPQRASLRQGAHVVVGTPGRLEEHVRKGSLSLEHVKVLVLDEADRMLDMGFEPQIAKVVAYAPRERQSLLFSATYPASIEKLSRAYQRGALFIDVADDGQGIVGAGTRAQAAAASEVAAASDGEGAQLAGGSPVEERFYRVTSGRKSTALVAWLARERPESALVFCNTRVECDQVADELRSRGWVAASIHGEMAQRERQHVMRLFANGSCTVLAATDVAARGWDLPDLPVVVQLGLSREQYSYLHRSGRTGRLGRSGKVVSFVNDEDVHALSALERARGGAITLEPAPGPPQAGPPPRPTKVTLLLSAGKNKKLRPSDVLGALTGEGGVSGSEVGAIQIDESGAYVAVATAAAERAMARLASAGIKGRSVKAKLATLTLREADS